MMDLSLSLILDGLVVLLSAGTIFYTVRLSFHIKAFRESRKDMEKLLAGLSASIEKAENAIGGLRENAKESGRDLQALINEAQALSEELQIMNQVGDSLAGKLEKLSDKKSKALSRERPEPLEPLADFAIRDSEFEEDNENFMDEGDLSSDSLSSQAERELYEALSQSKNTNKKMTLS